jgi:hypothetical protein
MMYRRLKRGPSKSGQVEKESSSWLGTTLGSVATVFVTLALESVTDFGLVALAPATEVCTVLVFAPAAAGGDVLPAAPAANAKFNEPLNNNAMINGLYIYFEYNLLI